MRTKILLFTFFISTFSFGQYWEEVLKQELFNSLTDPADSIYITDRNQLEKVLNHKCYDSIVTFNYNSKNGEDIQIEIKKGMFDRTKHLLHLTTEDSFGLRVTNIIDHRLSYGIDGNVPKTEIRFIRINWDGRNLIIPDTAYSNLYEPNLCRDYFEVESYLTEDELLFIYLNGSDGAGSYSVKFVFNNNQYLTRIVGTNEMVNGFDFLDNTAKVED